MVELMVVKILGLHIGYVNVVELVVVVVNVCYL